MKKIFTLLSFFLTVGFCQGQTNRQILFDQLYIPGIIAHNPINDIKQDHNGLMWFSTNDGIHRYDGYQFDTFNPDTALLALTFKKMLQINDSVLLVGTTKAGLLKFDCRKNKFSPIVFNNDSEGPIENILKDSRGTIWVDCNHAGLYKYTRDTLHFISSDTISAISISPTGSLQYASHHILKEIREGSINTIGRLAKNQVITSIGYNGSNIWLGTKHHGLYEMGAKGTVKLLGLNQSQVNDIFQDSDFNIWVLTHNDGVFLYSRGVFKQLKRKYYDEKSLTSDRALSVFQDANDIIWIGTGAGINKYDPYKNKFEVYRHDPLDESSISSDVIRGIYEDRSGNLWIGTEDGSINKLDRAKTKFRSKRLSLPGHSKIIPYDFYELASGDMLVATSMGVFTVSKDLRQLRPHKTLTYEAFNSSRARTIVPYKNDTLFILAEGSVFAYDLKKDLLERIQIKSSPPVRPSQAIDKYARTLYVDDEGYLWIGSYGTVARIELNTLSAQYYTFAENRGPMVMYIKKPGKYVWIGTFNGGLIKLNPEDGTFKTYSTADGLPNNAVYTAIPDNNNNLWISCNDGLSKFNIEDESFVNFDVNDGLQGEEFNRLAHCERKNGEIAIGGINGLNIFHPENVKVNPNEPHSVILNAEILNKFEDDNTALHPKIMLLDKDRVELSYEQNFLRFNFCSTHFSSPSENEFYYQLESFDENWIYADSKTSATYTGLKHGNYIFKVKSVSPDGLEETQYASIAVNIKAPFWMTWWFYAGIVLSLCLIGYITINRRLQQNKTVKILLEKEIERRTKELKSSKDELSDLNEKKDFIFSILSHDLRSPLTTLEGFLGLIINYYDQMEAEEIKSHAIAIKNSVGKSLDLIDNTLYWSLSQMGNISFSPVEINTSQLFDRVRGLYELTAQKKNVTLEFDNKHDYTIYADENMAYIIIRNLVSNAIKFTPEDRKVKVEAGKIDGMVTISVIDQGEGINPENMEKLFDQKPTLSKKGTSNEKGAGLGLILCKKFVDLNHGIISAKSSSEGSVFEVQLPSA